MAIRVMCEKCGQGYNVEAALAGKKVRCRHCQHVMAVPGAAGETRIEPALSPSDTAVVPALDAPPSCTERAGAVLLAPPVRVTPPLPRPELLEVAPRRSRALAGGSAVTGKAMQAVYANMGKLFLLALVAAISVAIYYGKDMLKGKIIHPPLPSLAEVQPGVLRAKVTLKSDGWMGDPPMDVWVYLPPGKHAAASLPCIFIAGAGSNLITGMSLGADDVPEHVPYVRAGFAVVAYDVDGMLKNRDRATEAEARKALREFIRAEGGVANARKAIDYLLDRVPQIDPKKLYAAGHSSAGTLALQVASRESRIAGCAAYAPAVDVEAFVRSFDEAGQLDSLERVVRGLKKHIRDYSPSNSVDRINCPVLLFVADDDGETAAEVRAFAARRPGQFRLVTVRSGGHRDSMIRDGIPAGIAFLGNMAGLSPQAVARGGSTLPPAPSNSNAWSGWRAEGAQPPPPPDAVMPPPPPAGNPPPPPGDQAVPPPPGDASVAPPPPVDAVMPPAPGDTAVSPPVPAGVTPRGPAVPEPPALTGEQQAIAQLQRLGAFVAMRGDAVESIDISQALDVDKVLELLPKLGKASVVRISSACLTSQRIAMLKKAPGLRRIEAESASIADAQLKVLADLTDLQELTLSANPITDAGLAHLKGMTGLTRLYLKDTKITSAGLIHLKGLTALHILDLSQTRVADAGLVHLKGLKGLIGLLLRNTDVTEDGTADLKKSLPRANIVGP